MSLDMLKWNGVNGPTSNNLFSLKGLVALFSEEALQVYRPLILHIRCNVITVSGPWRRTLSMLTYCKEILCF
jgi:hypothetical protein